MASLLDFSDTISISVSLVNEGTFTKVVEAKNRIEQSHSPFLSEHSDCVR